MSSCLTFTEMGRGREQPLPLHPIPKTKPDRLHKTLDIPILAKNNKKLLSCVIELKTREKQFLRPFFLWLSLRCVSVPLWPFDHNCSISFLLLHIERSAFHPCETAKSGSSGGAGHALRDASNAASRDTRYTLPGIAEYSAGQISC